MDKGGQVNNLTGDQPALLLVDDDWMNREIIQVQLELAGYRVIAAHGGEQAIELAHTDHPDLVLSDIRMIGMDGYAVCRALKSHSDTAHIPVILVTAHITEDDSYHANMVGAAGILLKPFDTASLSRQINVLLHR
ncbi:MAG: response regulator [Anaerolineae bacterium]|nr:response regulator [Anaerolineae bacterium]